MNIRNLKYLPLIVVLTLMFSAAIAFSAEEIITGTVESVVQAQDKNGAEYTRALVSFDRNLNGTEYSVILPVMGFGSQAEPLAKLENGQIITAVAQNRIFNGRESYTVITLIE